MNKNDERLWTDKEMESFIAFVQLLHKMEKEQEKMTEQEKAENAKGIKQGDEIILY